MTGDSNGGTEFKPRVVEIELDPSWADEMLDCWRCSYPITDWSDVIAVPTSTFEGDVPTGAAFVHRDCERPGGE